MRKLMGDWLTILIPLAEMDGTEEVCHRIMAAAPPGMPYETPVELDLDPYEEGKVNKATEEAARELRQEGIVKNEEPKTLPVIEVFGPVVAGEGNIAGRQTMFIRLGGCDYRCDWCDTLYAVLPDQVKQNSTRMENWQIMAALLDQGPECRVVTISGGNPCIHDLSKLVDALHMIGSWINVETQGSIWQEWLKRVDNVTVSPKPPSSGMATDYHKLNALLVRLIRGKCIKVVVKDELDFAYAVDLHKRCPGIDFYMQPLSTPTHYPAPISGVPQGRNPDADLAEVRKDILARTQWIIEQVCADTTLKDVRVIPQLHTLVYGQKRGV